MWASIPTNYIQHTDPALNREELLLPVSQRQKAVWTGADRCLHFTSVQLFCPFKHHAKHTCSQLLCASVFKLFQKQCVNIVSELFWCSVFLLESQKSQKWCILSDSSPTCRGNYCHFSAPSLTKAYPLRLLWETHCVKLCFGCTVMVFYL